METKALRSLWNRQAFKSMKCEHAREGYWVFYTHNGFGQRHRCRLCRDPHRVCPDHQRILSHSDLDRILEEGVRCPDGILLGS